MKQQKINYSNFYNQIWRSFFEKNRYVAGDLELSLQHLQVSNKISKNHKILEIGCGTGELAIHLDKLGFKKIICTDISSVAIDHAKNKNKSIDFRVMNATKLEFKKESFDACLSFDLIEHLFEIETHLAEVFRILKPNGVYVFQTPNILTNSLFETVKHKNFSWRKYHPSLQFPWSLKNKLKLAGFKSVEFHKISPVSSYKQKKLPFPLNLIIKNIPWKVVPLFLQLDFYVVAQK